MVQQQFSTRSLYAVKISLKSEGKMKIFSDKWKLRELQHVGTMRYAKGSFSIWMKKYQLEIWIYKKEWREWKMLNMGLNIEDIFSLSLLFWKQLTL